MELHKQGEIRVSVILPVYNHARWVEEAINSVLAQTFHSFELFIIDDASQDTSWDVIQKLCRTHQDPRIHCVRHANNQGAPASINEGLARAQGEYLCILNSDDVWDEQRLARLVAVAAEQSVDFLASDVALLDPDSQPKEDREPHWVAWFEGLKQDYAQHHDVWASLLRGNYLISTSNFFFHRRVLEQVGNFADLRYVHDYEYLLRVWQAGFQLQFLVGEKLLGYRLHDRNTIREKPLAAIEENMQMLLRYLPQLQPQLTSQRLQGLEIQLQDLYRYTREEWLTALHERSLEKDQAFLPLLADRDRWVAERDAWLAERDAIIQQQTTHIASLQQQVQEHQQWVADRDQWIGERDTWLVERDDIIQQQASALEQQQQHLQQQAQWVADRDRWISERDQRIQEQQQQVQRLQAQQKALLASRAFRLGSALLAPLRRCRQLFTEVKHA